MKLKTPRFLNRGPQSNGNDTKKHLVHNRFFQGCSRWGVYAALVTIVLGLILGIVRAVASSNRHGATSGPTAKERYANILTYLVESGVSSEEDLKRNGSPQNTALKWVSTEPLQEAVPTKTDGPVNPVNVMLVQRYVLAVLFFSTGGPSKWEDALGFTSNVLECSWNKIVPTPAYISTQVVEGVSCDTDLRVTSIFIPQNGLVGSLPSELQFLPHLDVINFQDNRLTGTIPKQYGNLLDLLYVNFNNNTLTGPVPDIMGNWKNLEVLGLALNKLEGTLPRTISMLPKLKTLALSGNAKLSGSLNALSALSSLKFFYASDCSFSGRVENQFFTSMPYLVQIDLSGNQLSGNVPIDTLLHEYNIEILDLARNNFEGRFPQVIERNVVTTYISLRENNITGNLPDSISALETLDHLDIQGNQLTGFLPNTLGGMKSLSYLFLGDNAFEDLVPPLAQLSQLKMLSLGKLNLSGRLMDWLVYLGSLELLDLSHNKFTGKIPQNVMNLPKLTYLMLNDNQLVGPMPTAGVPLKVFSIQRNSIGSDTDFAKVCSADRSIYTDCSASCKCCTTPCCREGDGKCGNDVDDYFLKGLDYTMSYFSFDPDILDEAGIFGVDEGGPN